MTARITFGTTLLVFTAAFALGKDPPARFFNYDRRHGLPSAEVRCIHQDRRGFIWVGTNFGLARFDGTRFTLFQHGKEDTNSLVNNTVNSIAEDRKGRLWIATAGGLSCFDPYTKRCQNWRPNGHGTRSFSAHCNVGVDVQGHVWIGHGNGVTLLEDGDAKKRIEIPLNLTHTPRGNRYIGHVFSAADGGIFLAASNGLYRASKGSRWLARYDSATDVGTGHRVQITALTRIAPDRDGHLWIGSYNHIYHKFGEQITRILLPDSIRTVMDVVADGDGEHLWLATQSGLVRMEIDGLKQDAEPRFTVYRHNPVAPYSLGGDDAGALMVDRDGTLWIASSGLSQLDPRSSAVTEYDYSAHSRFPPFSITPAAESEAWWILAGGNLLHFSLQTGHFTPHSIDPAPWYSWNIVERRRGGYWIVGSRALVQMNSEMQPVQIWSKETSTAWPYSFMHACEDSTGSLWLADYRRGLVHFNAAHGRLIRHLAGFTKDVRHLR